jgi:hypothetical protein
VPVGSCYVVEEGGGGVIEDPIGRPHVYPPRKS